MRASTGRVRQRFDGSLQLARKTTGAALVLYLLEEVCLPWSIFHAPGGDLHFYDSSIAIAPQRFVLPSFSTSTLARNYLLWLIRQVHS